MLKIGLTGGIASGKSTVADAFHQNYQIPVIDADKVARSLVAPNTPCLQAIVQRYGASILDVSGQLQRHALRKIIFANNAERDWLEHLLHPHILIEMQTLSETFSGPYILWMIPLLLEKNMQSNVDRILVVDCSPVIQRKRCMARDGISEHEAQAILDTQMTREEKLQFADEIIHNYADSWQDLQAQITKIHKKYLLLSQSQ